MFDLILALLLIMLILGTIQVIWAVLGAAVTESAERRRHWLLYLGGVAIYFSTYAMIADQLNDATIFQPTPNLYSVWFFGGAWSLAIYHMVIAAMPVERKPRPDAFEFLETESPAMSSDTLSAPTSM